jgi:predicted alpha-1,2-mannosidase
MRARTNILLAIVAAVGSLGACGDNGEGEPPLTEVTSAAWWVDPRIGTGGLGYAHGSCFVGAAAPHGLAKPGPDTSGLFGTINFQHYSGYFAEDDRIRGFSSLHLHGTGATDYGVLSVMPTLAFDPAKPAVTDYETRFDKTTERAEPGYYAVTLVNGIAVELTATTHVALHRYTFPDPGTIVIDLRKVLDGGEVDSAQIAADDATHELTGELHHLGGMTDGYGGYTVYFVIRTERAWQSEMLTTNGAALAVDAGTTSLAIGLSFVSVEGARANLDAEAGSVDVDAVHARTYVAWDELLSVVRLTGGTAAQRRTFYTSLYHTFLMPTQISDVDGHYRLAGVADPLQATGFRMLSDMSLWDTYRTVSPLHAWLAPASARDTVRSLVAFGQGLGIYPKWPLAIGETGTMLGASAEIVIADAVTRGVPDTHAGEAWPLLRAAALDPVAPPAGRGGRNDVEPYMIRGYVPLPTSRSVSSTVEYAHDDFALAQLAGALGHTSDRDVLAERAHGWRALYDADTGFLRARNADGAFSTEAFDPLVWDSDYAEANAWQSLFEPGIHDPDGIAEILGGRDAAIAKLSTLFTEAKRDWETSDESAANFPRTYYWAGNETDLNAAFLFAQLGRPDLTQQWVRWLVDTMYTDQPSGVPGNDDGGTLGAWYVLATLGVYPVAGSEQWILGAPRFPQARITIGDHELVIVAEGEGRYVAGVELDGVPLDVPQLTHAQLTSASTLTFQLADQPTHWAR